MGSYQKAPRKKYCKVAILFSRLFCLILVSINYIWTLYSMKIKEQTRKLAAGCSKHCFEVVDKTDEVSSKHCFEVVDRTDEVSNHIYGKATLTRFEEIFEEYQSFRPLISYIRLTITFLFVEQRFRYPFL